MRAIRLLIGAAGFLGACDHAPVEPDPAQPSVTSIVAVANPNNALSALLIVRTEGVDSARIGFIQAFGSAENTPFRTVRNGIDTLVALGLRPATPYTIWLEAAGSGVTVRSKEVSFDTNSLPPPLDAIRLVSTGAWSPGYTMIVPVFLGGIETGYVLIFDDTGALRWYHIVRGEGFAVEAKQQPNGNFSMYIGRSYGWQPVDGRFLEVRPDGSVVGTFAAPTPLYTDPHELILSYGGGALDAVHLFGYEVRQFAAGDPAGGGRTTLAVHRIVRQSALGQSLFTWSAEDHFSPTDWPPDTEPSDLVHPSSLAIDPDGDYVVSFQAMDEITRIDSETGAILWRFGGRHSDFVIDGDPLNGFQGQHSVRVLANGNLLLFDNRAGPEPLASRAVEYELDPAAGRARMVWQFRPDPPITSRIMGSVQRLRNGNTLVGFGVAGRVIEVGPGSAVIADGSVVQEGSAGAVQFYRAVRIRSLYRFEEP